MKSFVHEQRANLSQEEFVKIVGLLNGALDRGGLHC
jgi:hypothetical protein